MPVTATNSGDALRSFFDRRHPNYDEMVDHWSFLHDTYKGGRGWFESNLFKYMKEGPEEFKSRKGRSYRFNHTREVVDLVQKYLFKSSIARNAEEAPQEVRDFWASAMLQGFDIGQLMRQAAAKSSIGGRCALVVDSNHESPVDSSGHAIPVSVADASTSRVYSYVIPAEDVLDYAWDEDGDGHLLWVKLREWVRDDADPLNSSGIMQERIRLWTRDSWFVYGESGTSFIGRGKTKQAEIKQVDTGYHGLGEVPVRLLDHTISSDPYHCPGLIDDIAYLDRAVANYLSNLDAIIQDQTFSQLAIPATAIQRGDDAYNKVLEMGTKRMFMYDAGQGSTAKPEFLSPDPKQAGVILTVINKIINEIYHSVGLAGERTKEDNSVGIDNSSGVAKAYDFERVNSLLLSKAQSCEAAENWMVHMVMKWNGVDFGDKLVTYPVTFDVMRLADDLTTAEALQTVNAPDEVRRHQLRQMVDKLFPQLKADIKKKIIADIDKWKPSEHIEAKSKYTPGPGPSRQGSVTKDTDKGKPKKTG